MSDQFRLTVRRVCFVSLQGTANTRVEEAQVRLEQSIRTLGLLAITFPAGKKLIQFGEVLNFARSKCEAEAFVWCNSDLVLTRDPYNVPDPAKVYGFHRREIPSGATGYGIDMYYIPVKWWDQILSRDVPQLYLGAGYVDWWVSRAMQKMGAYENLTGYIDHVTHPTSHASGSDRNTYYQRNFRAYNRWAKRNGLEPIPAPPYLLPKLGHVWGIRDALRKMLDFRRSRSMKLQA